MSGPRLILGCGCEVAFREPDVREGRVRCATHGWQRVVRTRAMPPPRIVGVARGPHVTTRDLPAWRQPLVTPAASAGAETE